MLRQRAPGTGDERGSASVELAILFPALLLLVTGLIQYGLWFYARSVALAAAQEGVAVARSYDAEAGDGRSAALRFVDANGGDTLLGPTAVSQASGAGRVQVTVSGRSLSAIPGMGGIAVSQSAAGPVERFVAGGAP